MPSTALQGNGETILIADDEEAIRIVTSRTLTAFGYRTLLANDGAQAVRLYTENMAKIALVVTDMAMPGMDGPAAIKAMIRLNPAVKILAMSGYHPADDEGGNSLPPQVVGTLDKPYSTESLLRSIREGIAFPGTASPAPN